MSNLKQDLAFTKMQGAGNDFIIIDAFRESVCLSAVQIQALMHRHFGIGADQLLLVECSTKPGVDFRYRIFNADGIEVEHCGNGARCFVKFVHEKGLTDKKHIRVEVINGLLTLYLLENGGVKVDMGVPCFDVLRLPFDATGLQARQQGQDALWPLDVFGEKRYFSMVSMGNPHAVLLVDSLEDYPVVQEGAFVEQHARFPNKVNVGFMQILSENVVSLRVFERRAGETLACGTGACAAVAAGIKRGLIKTPVTVQVRGGLLTVDWDGKGHLWMSGPAKIVFDGKITATQLAQAVDALS